MRFPTDRSMLRTAARMMSVAVGSALVLIAHVVGAARTGEPSALATGLEFTGPRVLLAGKRAFSGWRLNPLPRGGRLTTTMNLCGCICRRSQDTSSR